MGGGRQRGEWSECQLGEKGAPFQGDLRCVTIRHGVVSFHPSDSQEQFPSVHPVEDQREQRQETPATAERRPTMDGNGGWMRSFKEQPTHSTCVCCWATNFQQGSGATRPPLRQASGSPPASETSRALDRRLAQGQSLEQGSCWPGGAGEADGVFMRRTSARSNWHRDRARGPAGRGATRGRPSVPRVLPLR